jgi:hypothetical protein
MGPVFKDSFFQAAWECGFKRFDQKARRGLIRNAQGKDQAVASQRG